ncbi:MAG TPA: hypothetical protein VE572_00585 [Nitrososphaeraceae archaeon]|nr:hypothetical protein [Nitrososphaeraceae archaeon]
MVQILVQYVAFNIEKSLKNLYYWILLGVTTTGVIMSQEELQRSGAKNHTSNANTLMRKTIIDPTKSLQPKIILSFEDICPHWSLALATGVSTNSHLDIREGKNCIVGEAHGFRNSAYICSKCWEYSQSFVSSVYGNSCSGYIITDHEHFESIKNDFVQHFNQKHAYRKSKVEKVRDHAVEIIRSFRSKLDQLTTDQIDI